MASRTAANVVPPRYTSVEAVARGGMGEIFKACDSALGRDVAVKLLAEDYARDPALRARFTREALAAARLSHDPHTVTIFDVGEWNERPYIVMEYVAGGTIADRLREGRHDPGESLRWLEQAAAALDAAHDRGVVHRDVKPANLLLTADGDVRVADFGIASAAGLTSVTETGSILGTIGYLAPEQALGGSAGPAADRYSLAVVAYELLAGRRPFQHATGAAEALAAGREQVPPISAERPGLPAALDAVFERALARAPEARHASCIELVGELRRAFADAAETTRSWTPPASAATRVAYRRSTPVRLLPWAVALAVLAGAGIAGAVMLTRDDGALRDAARTPPVKTITAKGSTVTVTTPATTTASPATTPPPPPPPPAAASSVGTALNDQGYRRMRAGDYRGALVPLEQAVRRLEGSGSLAEAYANYNLAFTRFALGRCDGVLELLDHSEAIQGHRNEIDALRRQARACGDGDGDGDD
jgi:tRNA A-37 threonylcarbamoyl transferase component Bud32